MYGPDKKVRQIFAFIPSIFLFWFPLELWQKVPPDDQTGGPTSELTAKKTSDDKKDICVNVYIFLPNSKNRNNTHTFTALPCAQAHLRGWSSALNTWAAFPCHKKFFCGGRGVGGWIFLFEINCDSSTRTEDRGQRRWRVRGNMWIIVHHCNT